MFEVEKNSNFWWKKWKKEIREIICNRVNIISSNSSVYFCLFPLSSAVLLMALWTSPLSLLVLLLNLSNLNRPICFSDLQQRLEMSERPFSWLSKQMLDSLNRRRSKLPPGLFLLFFQFSSILVSRIFFFKISRILLHFLNLIDLLSSVFFFLLYDKLKYTSIRFSLGAYCLDFL